PANAPVGVAQLQEGVAPPGGSRGRPAGREMVDMRRVLTLIASLILAAGFALAAVPAHARAVAAAQPAAARSVQADFNQDGAADLAIGIPFEGVGAAANAGAVIVLYGGTGKLTGNRSQLLTQVGSASEADDLFGEAL